MKTFLSYKYLMLSMALCSLSASALEKDSEGYYLIGSTLDLVDFAEVVNTSSTEKIVANARLTANIDLSAYCSIETKVSWKPIGIWSSSSHHEYQGTFDGQGYTIRNLYINSGNDGNLGLFGAVGGDVTIKNLVVTGWINSKEASAGIVANIPNDKCNITFENCGNEVTVQGWGDNACGGLLGYTWRTGNVTINNCYNTGDIKGKTNGALVGRTNQNITISNSFNTGTLKSHAADKSEDNELFNEHNNEAKISCTNCYGSLMVSSYNQKISADDVTSGKLAYLLNGKSSINTVAWAQDLTADAHPYPFLLKPVVFSQGDSYTNRQEVMEQTADAYSTLYYSTENLIVPENATAMTYGVDGSYLKVSKEYAAGSIVPTGEAVVVKADQGSYKFTVVNGSLAKDKSNLLKGVDEETEVNGSGVYYILSLNAQKDPCSVGFYWESADGKSCRVKAHNAFLEQTGATQTEFFLLNRTITAINGVEDTTQDSALLYSLDGVRVNNTYKGIVIKNGHKYILR